MKRGTKAILIGLGIFLFAIFTVAGWYLSNTLPIGTGHAAKTICSNVFIAKRNPDIVYQEDIAPVHFLFKLIDYKVDTVQKTVISDSFGFIKLKAIYRDGCGCTIVKGLSEAELRQQKIGKPEVKKILPRPRRNIPWPAGSRVPTTGLAKGVDADKLKRALDIAFSEPDPEKPRKTRAVVVVYDGQLIAERYAPGFDHNTPQLGWSMSKSVANALVGILVKKGKLDLYQPAPVPEWQSNGDPRRNITLDQLMRMSSGLEFTEEYAPFSDAVYMFYDSYDFAAYAAQKKLETEPDSKWHYSSGTANIIARIVRRAIEKDHENYYAFIHQELFDKIGMLSALMEPDPSGTFVGSSYTFATPRDWARFGLLYMWDGVWQGERILPEGWVEYTTTPTPKAPQGEYGALFWLNSGAASDPSTRRWPSISRDAFSAEGFQEQRVIIIPKKRLVLVRFGATSNRSAWSDEDFINNVLAALPE